MQTEQASLEHEPPCSMGVWSLHSEWPVSPAMKLVCMQRSVEVVAMGAALGQRSQGPSHAIGMRGCHAPGLASLLQSASLATCKASSTPKHRLGGDYHLQHCCC